MSATRVYKVKGENWKLKSMVSATCVYKVKGENGKRKSMVSATHIYKTYAKHTLLFSFQFSPFSLIVLRIPKKRIIFVPTIAYSETIIQI